MGIYIEWLHMPPPDPLKDYLKARYTEVRIYPDGNIFATEHFEGGEVIVGRLATEITVGDIVKMVKERHNIKTNKQKYEEVFGTTFGKHQEGIGGMPCPARSQEYCGTHRCAECRKWWDDEYREPAETAKEE